MWLHYPLPMPSQTYACRHYQPQCSNCFGAKACYGNALGRPHKFQLAVQEQVVCGLTPEASHPVANARLHAIHAMQSKGALASRATFACMITTPCAQKELTRASDGGSSARNFAVGTVAKASSAASRCKARAVVSEGRLGKLTQEANDGRICTAAASRVACGGALVSLFASRKGRCWTRGVENSAMEQASRRVGKRLIIVKVTLPGQSA
jgi:hypothetical protein